MPSAPLLHLLPSLSTASTPVTNYARTREAQPASTATSRSSLDSSEGFENIELEPLLSPETPSTHPTQPLASALQRPHVTYAQISYPEPPTYAEATGIVHADEHYELGPAYPNARALHVGNWMALRVGLLGRALFNSLVALPGYALAGFAIFGVLSGAAVLRVPGARAKADAAEGAWETGLDRLGAKIGNDVKRAVSAAPDQNRKVLSDADKHSLKQAALTLVGQATTPYEPE